MFGPDGKQVWKTPAGQVYRNDRGNGPRGTPTIDGTRLYALAGDGTLVCLEIATGKRVWGFNMIDKFGGGPVGLSTLSAATSEEADTIEDVYEPYLIQIGFLERTPKGRKVTTAARKHLGKATGKEQTLL